MRVCVVGAHMQSCVTKYWWKQTVNLHFVLLEACLRWSWVISFSVHAAHTDIHSLFHGKAHFGDMRREPTEPFSGQSLFPLIIGNSTDNSPSIIIIFQIFLLLPPHMFALLLFVL